MSNEFDDDDRGFARTTDPLSSHEALADEDLRAKIADKILQVALEAGAHGITINECAERLSEYKAWSLSPIFAPLIRKGLLIRPVLGRTAPSTRWPSGQEIYERRADPHTHKKCNIHYHHAVYKKPARPDHTPASQPERKLDHGS